MCNTETSKVISRTDPVMDGTDKTTVLCLRLSQQVLHHLIACRLALAVAALRLAAIQADQHDDTRNGSSHHAHPTYATILLDISDESQEDFDELLLERSPKSTYWLHFAVRPSGNRRKVRLIQT